MSVVAPGASDVRVELESDVVQAGAEVRGRVVLGAGAPVSVRVSFVWVTSGKGDADEGPAPPHDLAQPLADVVPFVLTAPASPFTYDGRLVKIRWEVRAEIKLNGGATVVARAPIRVEPPAAIRGAGAYRGG